MWFKMLKWFFSDTEHQTTGQAFIDEWENAIDMYGKIFSGLTLVATGAGLLDEAVELKRFPKSCST
jgi:hypothetical protein